MTLIKIKNLTKYYGTKMIFRDLNFILSSDYIYFLNQENGKGKTTFFKCLLKETDYIGKVYDKNYRYVYLPEKVILPSYAKAFEFVRLFVNLNKVKICDNVIMEYFKAFKIKSFKDVQMRKLSKGTKQKLLLIKTLLNEGDIFLLDEPLNGLDIESRNIFISFIKTLQENGKLIIIATHYYNEYNFMNKELITL